VHCIDQGGSKVIGRMSVFKTDNPVDIEARERAEQRKAIKRIRNEVVWTLLLVESPCTAANFKAAVRFACRPL
jgi:hypothetical protein